jgi:hypothetical protein
MAYCEISVFLQTKVRTRKMDVESARMNWRCTGFNRYAKSFQSAQKALVEAQRILEQHAKHCGACFH